MSAPVRIQLRRTEGWRMPENTVRCCRPGKWGNPFVVSKRPREGGAWARNDGLGWRVTHYTASNLALFRTEDEAREHAITMFRRQVMADASLRSEIRRELAGKNLACFCAVSEPCHADVYLEVLASGEVPHV